MDQVTLDRGDVEELLGYAEDEIETRCSCLKDAGEDRAELEQEISDGQDLLASVRKALG